MWAFRKSMLYQRCRRFIGTVPYLCGHAPSVFGSHPTAGRDFCREQLLCVGIEPRCNRAHG
jgi:hypothetical protein